jgi:hypothetical protein
MRYLFLSFHHKEVILCSLAARHEEVRGSEGAAPPTFTSAADGGE